MKGEKGDEREEKGDGSEAAVGMRKEATDEERTAGHQGTVRLPTDS